MGALVSANAGVEPRISTNLGHYQAGFSPRDATSTSVILDGVPTITKEEYLVTLVMES
jgi:hypothetical protein